MPQTNDQLIAQAIAGDRDALTELLHQCTAPLTRLLSQKIGRRWRSMIDVDDVMQITYLEAFLRIDRFVDRGPGSFQAWLTRIAENNLRDGVRELQASKRPPPQARLQMPAASDDSFIALFDLMGCTSTTPSRQVATGEAKQVLQTAIAQLPADYVRVIEGYDLQGLDIAGVAAVMQRSPGAVHMLRARAHQRLRELLGAPWRFFSHSA